MDPTARPFKIGWSRKLAAGDSFTVLVAPATWDLGSRRVVGALVRDKIDRTYAIDPFELKDALAEDSRNRVFIANM